ncbi:sodium:proton antiporter [Massilia sp. Root351]|jgi:NhaP-type Na+/H+ or K+/H+ antiporter|uniref:cation:proton antiporter n=1 Tax=Massilia sp. Root351 TaxID=1736522 RepID=UPI00070EA4C9|nr:cation:proton antiporter [Massilia sp. Root351]KQV80671.1 sodium:proton antiporter [Massilia sp. Root351]
MSTTLWFILIGCLMLARGLAATTLARLPVTSAIVYLGVGLALGPAFFGVFAVDPYAEAGVLEVMTELAVLISLFSAGVKMPVPFSLARWAPSLRLAWLSMSISVGLMAAFGTLVLGLPLGAAVLLGAILAPTDPVLATDVQVRHAGDRDQLRFALTSEAGMNDGSAFPFVMLGLGLLGLHELGDFGWRWLAMDVLWGTMGAVLIGIAGGAALAQLGWALRNTDPRHDVLDDLVGLGLIAVVYGACLWLHAWGFLAVFFAGVALRQRELVLAGAGKDRHGLLKEPCAGQAAAGAATQQAPGAATLAATGAAAAASQGEARPGASHAPAPTATAAGPAAAAAETPAEAPLTVSGESLIFKEHLERLSELTLVLLLGGAVTAQAWDWRAWSTALFLFAVARPLSVYLGLVRSTVRGRVRGISAWFGVRGIGSVYYLMYAINHGLPQALARELIDITLVVIMLSIAVHGISVKPLFDRFWSD